MAVKNYKTRIRLKRDTSANWTANNPVLLDGEIIIVDTAGGDIRTKTGDGVKTYTQLPFNDEALYNAINGKCDASISVETVLAADAWSDDGQQTINVAGVTATTNGVIGVTHGISDEQLTACGDAALYIYNQGDGYLTIAANGSVPACDIPVVVILLG